MHVRHFITLLLLLAPAAHATAAPPPSGLLQQGFRVDYTVTHKGLPMGTSERVLRPAGNGQWSFNARTAPTGLVALLFGDVITEHSRLQLTPAGVRPLEYAYDRQGGRKEQHYSLRFDWPGQTLHFSHGGRQLPLPAAAQDPLSFLIEVMVRLQADEREFAMSIAGRNKVRDYRLHSQGETTLKTPLGKFRVLLVQAKELGQETYYDLWCAPELDYLPVRIRQRRKDETTDLRLSSFSPLSAVNKARGTAMPDNK